MLVKYAELTGIKLDKELANVLYSGKQLKYLQQPILLHINLPMPYFAVTSNTITQNTSPQNFIYQCHVPGVK